MIRLADYVIDFLVKKGITDIFLVSGGGIMYLCDAVGMNKKIKYKILNTAKNEIPYQSLNYSKIRKILGWKPKENIKTIAEKIFE